MWPYCFVFEILHPSWASPLRVIWAFLSLSWRIWPVISLAWSTHRLAVVPCGLSCPQLCLAHMMSFSKFWISFHKLCPIKWRIISLTWEERHFFVFSSLIMVRFVHFLVQTILSILCQHHILTASVQLLLWWPRSQNHKKGREYQRSNQMGLYASRYCPALPDLN